MSSSKRGERLKYIVDNVRVCVDGVVRIKPMPQPAADATRPIALAALLNAIDSARANQSPYGGHSNG